MYILLKKDNYCEISIAKKFINLFYFQPPFKKEQLEIIAYVKMLTKAKKKYSIKAFIKRFNSTNSKYEILCLSK